MLKESILKEISGVKPHRRICDQTDTRPAASAAELVPNVLGFLSFGAYQQRREGDPDAWATQVLHIICPGLHPGEDTPASPHQGLLSTVGEILGSHWTATARLKLGSPEPDLCCPATIRLPHWVYEAYGQHQTSEL